MSLVLLPGRKRRVVEIPKVIKPLEKPVIIIEKDKFMLRRRARELIETKIENGKFDEFEVCDWLGHDDVKTTMTYIKDAKQYYTRAPYNWLKRVLKFHKNQKEDNTLNQDNPILPAFRLETTGLTRSGSTGTCALQQEGNRLRYSLYNVSWVISSLSLIFSFSFFELRQLSTSVELSKDFLKNNFSTDKR